jgi:glycosyltransferase involved in cell wall biosynthesis
MAEKVRDGIDGLHFSRGDTEALARTIKRAATTPGLWQKLRAEAPPIYDMKDHLSSLGASYRDTMAARRRRQAEHSRRPTDVRKDGEAVGFRTES